MTPSNARHGFLHRQPAPGRQVAPETERRDYAPGPCHLRRGTSFQQPVAAIPALGGCQHGRSILLRREYLHKIRVTAPDRGDRGQAQQAQQVQTEGLAQ
jgi:hypothetical protein